MRKILSSDDYVNLAARLDHAWDSEVLLNFMLNVFAHLASKSGPGPDAVEISRRVRRLVIEVFISNMWHGIPLSDDIYLTQSCTFPFLLFLLDHLQKVRKISNPQCSSLDYQDPIARTSICYQLGDGEPHERDFIQG